MAPRRMIALVLLAAAAVAGSAAAQEVPIRLERDRVFVPTTVNGSAPLLLILDTGMRFDGVYLFRAELAALVDTVGARLVRVGGAGEGEASTALMIEDGRLGFGPVAVDSQRVIISRSAHTQDLPSDGVIGWNLFGHHTVEIDYDRSVIRLHPQGWEPAPEGWTRIPVLMRGDLPWFEVEVEVVPGEVHRTEVYVDLAGRETLELLVGPGRPWTPPGGAEEVEIGVGLSGPIHGWYGRVTRLSLPGFDFRDVLTAWAPAEVRSRQEGAQGVVANGLFQRFGGVVFDYENGAIWVREADGLR